MLPLSFATGLAVLVGDGRRALAVTRRSRRDLLRCAAELRGTAAAIEAATPDLPAAGAAAQTARKSAAQLDRLADRVGRRGLFTSQVLSELLVEAVSRSYLPRRDAVPPGARRAPVAPAHILQPSVSVELRTARVARQRHARSLRDVVERALNEAGVHGVGPVYLTASLEHDDARRQCTT